MNKELIELFKELQNSFSNPTLALWEKLLAFLPNLFASIIYTIGIPY